MNDFTTGTVAGVNFDQIAITGSLDLTGGSANSFLLDLKSLLADNSAGNVGNSTDIGRSWDIITMTGGITVFDVADWQIQTTSFTSNPSWTGTWSVSKVGNNEVLNYVATVPGAGAGRALPGGHRNRGRRLGGPPAAGGLTITPSPSGRGLG